MSGANDFDLFRTSEFHEELRAAVQEVVKDKIAPYAAAVDEEARYPQEAHDALVASDFFAPHVPEEYDGVGADALATCIVIEEVARADASASLIPAVNKLGSMPVILGGSEAIKATYLPPLARGEAGFSYGLSEREAGSDTAGMKCRAKSDGDHFVLNGQKSWITNAGVSQYYTVLAVTDPDGPRGNNVTAFVVEKSDEGFTFGEKERKLGIKGSPTRELHFDNCRIPADRMVGDPGEGLKIALRTLDHTRVTIGAQAVGIAQGALDHALAYVKERKQFGKHIADFQGIQFMLADMAMELEAARQMVYVAAAKSERNDADLSFFGAAAKCYASDVAMRVTTDAVQLLGGAGYTRDFPLERMMRDAKITQIYEGTNQIQRIVMARQLLKG
ncbi:MAG: acyl-CoA dehydrogenase family protein [Phycicoccus sp.]|uniref:acyl-CoA dehydrogenase family protein n=2 Tax=Intrasporangiaceae TaxID=85021 RepID=UPI00258EF17D|nr:MULTISPECIES: acyl-CoA dehydrogenase family protein [Phycicoccus]MCB9407387.1 acyl-CoA dehydrogenase family protein [Tetrasphaera sp.]MCO5302391.1 acyl-CoA dehydrogenase family protein [Phycicoccus sp.]HPQ73051.1 acyl-CoA dehydrogenase family protein [Phycicoccus elongatus]